MNAVLYFDTPSRPFHGLGGIFSMLALLLAIMGMAAPAAAQQSCAAMGMAPSVQGDWQVVADANGVRNGDVLATLRVAAAYQVTQQSIGRFEIYGVSSGKVDSNSYGAWPLSGTPGVGLRMRWQPAWSSVPMSFWNEWSANAVISNGRNSLDLLQGQSSRLTNYVIATNYALELVMLDSNAYLGGQVVYRDNYMMRIVNSVRNLSQNPVMCNGGMLELTGLMKGQTKLPVLPRAPVATCHFANGSLDQTVTLAAVTSSNVAANGAPRSAGREGEKTFTLVAGQCDAGARFNIYFTDANSMASRAEYLVADRGTRGGSGLRLYAGTNTTPVTFGPAPSGNSVPANVAVSAGPANANQTLVLPFTVQHVRLPDVQPGDVAVGRVNARATVTVVYP